MTDTSHHDISDLSADPAHMVADAGTETAVDRPAPLSSLAKLLTGHILQDGELVLLILKPSRWLILLESLKTIAVMLVVALGVQLWPEVVSLNARKLIAEVAGLVVAARVMWATVQWMGRLYILTDLRIVRLQGVFHIDVFDCPLRKIARVRPLISLRERLLRLGSIEIIPQEEELPIATWQTIKHPRPIYKQIIAAINRARQRNLY